jgi:hypothetical protein
LLSTLSIAPVAAATVLAVSGPASADHIPGHDDSDPVFPIPMPGPSDFSGGGVAIWMTAIGPNGGSEVTKATFDFTYVSDGATPASDLLLNVGHWVESAPGEVVYVETIVTGADLGFTSGAGTFHGTFETTALNGVTIEHFLVAPNSLMDLIIDSTTGGVQGTAYFVDSFIYLDLNTDPSTCTSDLDGDDSVGFSDLSQLLAAWGSCPDCAEDLDGNGSVGFSDLSTMLSTWGACP